MGERGRNAGRTLLLSETQDKCVIINLRAWRKVARAMGL